MKTVRVKLAKFLMTAFDVLTVAEVRLSRRLAT